MRTKFYVSYIAPAIYIYHIWVISPGLGQSQAKPSQHFGFWPGLGYYKAQAASSQAKAGAFRPSRSRHITTHSAVTHSVLKSGPVSVLLPFLEGPQTGPVPECKNHGPEPQKTTKNRSKLVVTGLGMNTIKHGYIEHKL